MAVVEEVRERCVREFLKTVAALGESVITHPRASCLSFCGREVEVKSCILHFAVWSNGGFFYIQVLYSSKI